MNPDLTAALTVVAAGCAALQDAWWVFGGAAIALAGVPDLSPPDIDLIVSERDAASLITKWNAQVETDAPSPLFRSRVFARTTIAPLPIEIMAGFEVCEGGAWSAVLPATRQRAAFSAGAIFIPTPAEQADICRRFGRPKDLARIPALQALH